MSLRPLFTLLAPAGVRARLNILIFHRVLPAPDPLFPSEIDAAMFDAICGWLKAWFQVLPLDEAVRRLSERSLPARALAITFDDGYADNEQVALPILQRHGLCATFFVATGFLDGGRMWNDSLIETVRRSSRTRVDLQGLDLPLPPSLALDSTAQRRQAIDGLIGAIKYLPVEQRQRLCEELAERAAVRLPDDLMMSSDQVVALRRAGMQVGAHTVSHPILARLDAESMRAEIAASKMQLEHLLGEPVDLFAYPNGKPGEDYNDTSVAVARSLGFKAAVSTAWGAARADADLFQLPRFTPWDRSRLRFGGRLAHNLWAR
ncbi:polysaccharide deacetylase family protein [Paucibacter sp. XJ19-41]|uniref:polysaccharide deacetylase family protein n=1 Tax=Paucibacter sp. XJ19-41 TaxID=2927824 RepID=UPI00234BA750|nr:polysaccharide deacetylase family protein [Paucibacter sp. XJ19-41]MDC6166102.1 polysaccharide deacetylase family protein [Paucibacter sp. XJ19-41]